MSTYNSEFFYYLIMFILNNKGLLDEDLYLMGGEPYPHPSTI